MLLTLVTVDLNRHAHYIGLPKTANSDSQDNVPPERQGEEEWPHQDQALDIRYQPSPCHQPRHN